MEIKGISKEICSLTYTIQNIVVKSSLNLDVDLKKLSKNLDNGKYNSDHFPGLFLRLNNPKCVTIIFSNGKMILTGIRSFDHINLLINKIISELNEKGKINRKINFNSVIPEVVNIVITADFFKKINLDLAIIKLENSVYEPEIFPGLVYHSCNPKRVFLIFSTGKVVLTGIRERKGIEPALISLGRLLKKEELFLKNNNNC
ncbi:MAG: TATA-box-binding protein [Promethearchaeota archaeon]